MATVELKARKREATGKGVARKARGVGLVPAVLYGEGEKPQPLEVSYKDFYPVIRTAAGENVILDLVIEGGEKSACKAIIREIQYHPVRGEILHVDFQHISMTKEIAVNVPIEIVGEAVGVKTHGGILEVILREVEVECLPVNIPDVIRVDVTELDIGDSVQVRDLECENVSITTDLDSTVITIVAPTVVEEVKVAAAEEAEEAKLAEEGVEKKEEEKERDEEEGRGARAEKKAGK
jgi:large subunit ribosomal protein L25